MTLSQRNAEIGARMAAIRHYRGMTEQQLGAAIGVSGKTIWAYEHGHVNAAFTVRLEKIAVALHCTRKDLEAPANAPLPRPFRAHRRPQAAPAKASDMSGPWKASSASGILTLFKRWIRWTQSAEWCELTRGTNFEGTSFEEAESLVRRAVRRSYFW